MLLSEIILTKFQIVSGPEVHRISSKLFEDNSKLCLSHISLASHRNYSKTIPSCVLAKIQLQLIGIILRQCQIVSKHKFNCFSAKLFLQNSKLFIGRKSIASHRSYSKTIPNCVLAIFHLLLIEIIPRQFQIES